MSEASPAIIGSIVGAYIFALLGCAGTAVWLLRLNPGPAAKAIETAEDTAAGNSLLDIPGVPDPKSVMNSALTGQGGAAGIVGNALNNNPAAGLVGKQESLNKIGSLGQKLENINKEHIEQTTLPTGSDTFDNDALDAIGAEGRKTDDLSITDHDFANKHLLKPNDADVEGLNTMNGGRKKTKTNRRNSNKLTNEPKVKQSVKRQRKPRTKKCLVTKGNQMYMSFCV